MNVYGFFFYIYPEAELLDYMVVLLLVFWGTSIQFSIVVAAIYIPTNSVQVFSFLRTLTNICYLYSFYDSHSDRGSHCGFDLYFPDD